MPMWRCPHCSAPQLESARCWVCLKSTTSCGTCRHFRRSVVAQVGYCGMDRSRSPLDGDELRACWEARPRTRPAGVPASEEAGVAPTAASAGAFWLDSEI